MSDHYTYRVLWSSEDDEFVGLCAEFASLSHLAPDQVEALVGIRALVSDVVADMRRNGEPVPEPFADRAYSGRFVARIPSELHRRLIIEAAEEGVSLNRLVSNKLAAAPIPVFKQSPPSRNSGVKKRAHA
jgi:predicted HicB family RNase H-like nuclease